MVSEGLGYTGGCPTFPCRRHVREVLDRLGPNCEGTGDIENKFRSQ